MATAPAQDAYGPPAKKYVLYSFIMATGGTIAYSLFKSSYSKGTSICVSDSQQHQRACFESSLTRSSVAREPLHFSALSGEFMIRNLFEKVLIKICREHQNHKSGQFRPQSL